MESFEEPGSSPDEAPIEARGIRPSIVVGVLLLLAAALLWRDYMGPPIDFELRAPAVNEGPRPSDERGFEHVLDA